MKSIAIKLVLIAAIIFFAVLYFIEIRKSHEETDISYIIEKDTIYIDKYLPAEIDTIYIEKEQHKIASASYKIEEESFRAEIDIQYFYKEKVFKINHNIVSLKEIKKETRIIERERDVFSTLAFIGSGSCKNISFGIGIMLYEKIGVVMIADIVKSHSDNRRYSIGIILKF